jgi:GNAT superfamily N-acetyltransferase
MPDKKLESTGMTLDGTPIALRPLLPEDEPALQDLFAHMSREDVRLRFFTPMRELKYALAARLSHLDYSREMALVAQHEGMTLGVARYSADPDRRSAEFAVAVRSDWHGRGVGQLLMARLIEAAQQSGISELVGLVLHENNPMLNMCRKLGFSIAPEPNDAAVLRVRKSLASVRRLSIGPCRWVSRPWASRRALGWRLRGRSIAHWVLTTVNSSGFDTYLDPILHPQVPAQRLSRKPAFPHPALPLAGGPRPVCATDCLAAAVPECVAECEERSLPTDMAGCLLIGRSQRSGNTSSALRGSMRCCRFRL